MLNIQEIIAKKRDKKKLTEEDIKFFVEEYTKGNIADYQASALVMAIYINGMDEEETTNLALNMAKSGDILDLSDLGNVVDKHSTGGVGDKVTLILAPIIASLGVPVAKMSGRGLGYTGGTIDKLESIPGYNVNLSEDKFKENVKKIGISLIGQTLNLAPADKKIYALRDATSTTESIPLIASSIMSKKIAAGANKIVLDVTYGSGAFMKTKEKAQKLAEAMIKIGKLAKRETVAVLTPMEQPLGRNVGNTLEVIEAVEALKGNIQEDVEEVVFFGHIPANLAFVYPPAVGAIGNRCGGFIRNRCIPPRRAGAHFHIETILQIGAYRSRDFRPGGLLGRMADALPQLADINRAKAFGRAFHFRKPRICPLQHAGGYAGGQFAGIVPLERHINFQHILPPPPCRL